MVVFMTPSKPPIKSPFLTFVSIVPMEQSMDMNEQMMYSQLLLYLVGRRCLHVLVEICDESCFFMPPTSFAFLSLQEKA